MFVPVIRGLIDRRILANYRVDPDVLAAKVPAPFRVKTIAGYGIAGVCLIRLSRVRPRFVPSFLGLGSENAAHRIAVEWDTADGVREGVFIPRRDTSSWLNTVVGGRLFPGVHCRAIQVESLASCCPSCGVTHAQDNRRSGLDDGDPVRMQFGDADSVDAPGIRSGQTRRS